MQTRYGFVCLALMLAGCAVPSQERDVRAFHELLDGWWDEGRREDMRQFCNSGRMLSRHVFSAAIRSYGNWFSWMTEFSVGVRLCCRLVDTTKYGVAGVGSRGHEA
jgi:hypothetical protein